MSSGGVPAIDRLDQRIAAPAVGLRSTHSEENPMLLHEELARERIRDLEHAARIHQDAARIRAMRRARRDAQVRAARVRRILLAK